MFLSAGVAQGRSGQKGAIGLPGITGNMVRYHIMPHPVAIIYLLVQKKKKTAIEPSEFIPLFLSRE